MRKLLFLALILISNIALADGYDRDHDRGGHHDRGHEYDHGRGPGVVYGPLYPILPVYPVEHMRNFIIMCAGSSQVNYRFSAFEYQVYVRQGIVVFRTFIDGEMTWARYTDNDPSCSLDVVEVGAY